MFGSVAGRPHNFTQPTTTSIPASSVPSDASGSLEEEKAQEPSIVPTWSESSATTAHRTELQFGGDLFQSPQQQRVIYITSVGVQTSADRKREARSIVSTYLGLWIALELCVVAFLTTFLSTPNFSELRFNQACQVINPRTQQRQPMWFLQLYGGFSGQRSFCPPQPAGTAAAIDAGSLCIPWSDAAAWQRFEQAAGFFGMTYPDTPSTLSSAQALVPCSLFFLLLAMALHSTVLGSPLMPAAKAIWMFHLASWSLLLAWILLISAQSVILYAPPFVPSLWTSFFRQGYSLAYLLSPDTAAPTAAAIAANAGCAVAFSCESKAVSWEFQ